MPSETHCQGRLRRFRLARVKLQMADGTGEGKERTISLGRGCQPPQKNEHYIKPCILGQRLEHGIYEREVPNIFISKVVRDQKVCDVCRCAAGKAVSVYECFHRLAVSHRQYVQLLNVLIVGWRNIVKKRHLHL